MLGKTGKKNKSILDFSSEEINGFVDALFANGKFVTLVSGMIDGKIDSPGFKRSVTAKIKSLIPEKSVEPIVLNIGESDLLVIPGDGISGDEVSRLISIMPKDRFLGVIIADGIKVLRIT